MYIQQLSSPFDLALSEVALDFAREIEETTSGKNEDNRLDNDKMVTAFAEFNWINRIYQLVMPEYSMS